MHQPVMLQNKQENYTDFPYKALLQQNLQNGRLKREVCADTLMNGKVIMYVTQRNVYLKIVRCITPCMRNGRHSEYWLLTTGIMHSHLYPDRKNLGAATLLSSTLAYVSLFVKACLCETLCIVCTQHNQIFYMLMHEFCLLQSSGPMSASETRRSMMDFLDTIMSDIHSHSEGGQYSRIIAVWEAIKQWNSG